MKWQPTYLYLVHVWYMFRPPKRHPYVASRNRPLLLIRMVILPPPLNSGVRTPPPQKKPTGMATQSSFPNPVIFGSLCSGRREGVVHW